MFRTLATRLIASYVFAAIVLVFIVAVAVTAFSLSMFAIGTKETMEAVAREAPEEARIQIGRYRSLAAAAGEMIGHLARPGVRIGVLADRGREARVLVIGGIDDEGRPFVRSYPLGHPAAAALSAVPPPGGGAEPAGRPPPDDLRPPGSFGGGPVGALRDPNAPGGGPYFHDKPFPFGLNAFMHIEPRKVAVDGGEVTVMPDPRPLSHAIDAFWFAMLPIGLFVVVAAWFLGRYITGQALRPLVETTAALNRFAGGDFTPRSIVTSDRSEIGELVSAYNGAVAQVSAAFEERRSVELQMRQFIADAGHELRTPLTVIMGFIDVLRRRASHDSGISTKIYDTMLFESRRMRALIDKLIVLARLENPAVSRPEAVDLADVAGRIVTAQQALASKARVALRGEPGTIVRGDEAEIYEAISNLVDNALKYAPLSAVEVGVRREGSEALIEVVDHGPGVSPHEQEHIFDRFYRGENGAGSEGFGLGLAIVKRAVERAGGRIALHSVVGQGCRFAIHIPLASSEQAGAIAV